MSDPFPSPTDSKEFPRRLVLAGAIASLGGVVGGAIARSHETPPAPAGSPRQAGTNALDYVGRYGRTCRAIQAAIDACPEGATVTVPSGDTWTVTRSIVRKKNVSVDLTAAILRATVPIPGAILDSAKPQGSSNDDIHSVKDNDFFVRGGTIDCAHLAAIGIRCRFYHRGVLERISVTDAASRSFVLGTSHVGEPPAAASYGMYVSGCVGDRKRPAQAPVGSVGMEIFSTDTFTAQCVMIGSETGFAMRAGSGSGHHLQNQAWARIPENTMKVCYRVEASNQVFVDCMADTPSERGWVLDKGVWSVTWIGCKHFNNDSDAATDNVAISVELGDNCRRLTSMGMLVRGSDGHRIAKDWLFGNNTPTAYDYSIVGTSAVWLGTSDTPTLITGSNSVTGGDDLDIPFLREGVTRWLQRFTGTENSLEFRAHSDNGEYSHTALSMDRSSKHTAISIGVSSPARLSPGQATLWVDEMTNELKLSWRGHGDDTSVRTRVIST